MSLLCPPGAPSCAIYDDTAMFRTMSNDTFFARCGELIGRWTTAFADGLSRGRAHKTAMPMSRTPWPAGTTSDPELHPQYEPSSRPAVQWVDSVAG
jgi:hypothetical protein